MRAPFFYVGLYDCFFMLKSGMGLLPFFLDLARACGVIFPLRAPAGQARDTPRVHFAFVRIILRQLLWRASKVRATGRT